MLNKIKEYLETHPNSGIFTAFLFSITTMNTEELISLITAIGMIVSAVFSAFMQFLRYRQKKQEDEKRIEIEQQERLQALARSAAELERYRLETSQMFSNFDTKQINIENG